MSAELQKWVKEILNTLEVLPEVPEGSLESEFRDSVKMLCKALEEPPKDDGPGQFLAPNPFTD